MGTVIDAVLTALVAMQPVSAAPSFAIVVWDGAQVELLVRGRVIVEVWTGDGGHERVTGVGTHTWRGQSFAGVVSLVARLDDDADRADYPLWFSARSGVIPASTISWHHGETVARPYAGPAGSDPEPARDVDPQPEPVPQPDPEPDLQPEVAAAEELLPPLARGAVPAVIVDAPSGEHTRLYDGDSPSTDDVPAALSSESEEPTGQESTAHDPSPVADDPFGDSMFRTRYRDDLVADQRSTGLIVSVPHDAAAQQAPSTPPPAPHLAAGAVSDGHTAAMSPELRAKVAALRASTDVGPAAAAPTAPTARVRIPGGIVLDLDREIVLGRAPHAPHGVRFSGKIPHLVEVGPGDESVSRTHAMLRPDGPNVLVTDLGSSNGTRILVPGRPAARLTPHEDTSVPIGTEVELSPGVKISITREKAR
ncbi:MAG: FHA domain-containing protein [Actinobacteria bacterium]|nr:FHA domain-containing protein [Actinomycetota bacterium]